MVYSDVGMTVIEELISGKPKSVDIYIPAFPDGGRIPRRYTCDGLDISPEIRISRIPENTEELALIMYDPDAPIGTFYHWGLYKLRPQPVTLPEDIPKTWSTSYGFQARNDFGKAGYGGPCPPRGHGTHRYFFLVTALSSKVDLRKAPSIRELIRTLKGRVIAYGVYMGRYSR